VTENSAAFPTVFSSCQGTLKQGEGILTLTKETILHCNKKDMSMKIMKKHDHVFMLKEDDIEVLYVSC
jgi:hypothetical protein